MLLATLPRVVGPGEIVDLPVTVFAMDAKVKDVDVRLKSVQAAGDGFKVAAQRTLIAGNGTMQFRSNGDLTLQGDLRVDSGVTAQLQAGDAHASASHGSRLLAHVSRVDFSKANGLRVVGAGTVDVNLDKVQAKLQ